MTNLCGINQLCLQYSRRVDSIDERPDNYVACSTTVRLRIPRSAFIIMLAAPAAEVHEGPLCQF